MGGSCSYRSSLLWRLVVVVFVCASYTVAEDNNINFLMIGNSYIMQHNTDQMVKALLKEGLSMPDDDVYVHRHAKGGALLGGHSRDRGVTAMLSDENDVQFRPWTWVLLQEQSQVPGFYQFDDYQRRYLDPLASLNKRIVSNGDGTAGTVIFMSWGRLKGDELNPVLYKDFIAMNEHITKGFLKYRDAVSTPERPVLLAPVGPAYKAIYDSVVKQGLDPLAPGSSFSRLYAGDGSHPSAQGAYLAACVIYGTVTGKDPRLLKWKHGRISESDRDRLQNVAFSTVEAFEQHTAAPQNDQTKPLPSLMGPMTQPTPEPTIAPSTSNLRQRVA